MKIGTRMPNVRELVALPPAIEVHLQRVSIAVIPEELDLKYLVMAKYGPIFTEGMQTLSIITPQSVNMGTSNLSQATVQMTSERTSVAGQDHRLQFPTTDPPSSPLSTRPQYRERVPLCVPGQLTATALAPPSSSAEGNETLASTPRQLSQSPSLATKQSVRIRIRTKEPSGCL